MLGGRAALLRTICCSVDLGLISSMHKKPDLLTDVARYYTGKLSEHGATPRGVDWNGAESQELRFTQLCKIIESDRPFSVNDLGCGYGALYEFLAAKYPQFSYVGIDVSQAMIETARQRLQAGDRARFTFSNTPDAVSDYGIASGIFSVKLDKTDVEWWAHMAATLDILNETSRIGFAFNCLTSYSDTDKMRPDLYYADPCAVFDHCKRRYSRQVALLHDYGLYEFVILVRKQV
jgi:SAM-dependent methyltransferase